jgi:hypothetical protein
MLTTRAKLSVDHVPASWQCMIKTSAKSGAGTTSYTVVCDLAVHFPRGWGGSKSPLPSHKTTPSRLGETDWLLPGLWCHWHMKPCEMASNDEAHGPASPFGRNQADHGIDRGNRHKALLYNRIVGFQSTAHRRHCGVRVVYPHGHRSGRRAIRGVQGIRSLPVWTQSNKGRAGDPQPPCLDAEQ